MHNFKKALLPLMAAAAMFGCANENTGLSETQSFQDKQNGVAVEGRAVAVFKPSARSASSLPFPTDLFFAGTKDGSLNIPGKVNSNSAKAPTTNLNDPQVALNTLDGFSTTSPITVRTSVAVDADTLKKGIKVYEASTIDPASKTMTAIGRTLKYGLDFVASVSSENSIAVIPLAPLKGGTTYYVVATTDLKSTSGAPIGSDSEYIFAKSTSPLITKQDGTACDFSSTAALASCTKIVLTVLPDVASAITFERIRQQANAHEALAVATDSTLTDRNKIALGFSFSTQNIGTALLQAKSTVIPQMLRLSRTAVTVTTSPAPALNPSDSLGLDLDNNPATAKTSLASIFAATFNRVPQFLDPENPADSFWKGDPDAWQDLVALGNNATAKALCDAAFSSDIKSENLVSCNGFRPKKVADISMPMLISVPKAATVNGVRAGLGLSACPANLPVTIYQHGITASRGTLMAIADTLALQCQIVVAIDLPQHGIDSADATFGQLATLHSALYNTVKERRVGTGKGFINLKNLANSRDNVRQAASDLTALLTVVAPSAVAPRARIRSSLDGKIGAGISVDQSKVSFLGMSLGGIVGMPFVAQQPGVKAVVINGSGGGIGKLLDGSISIQPDIVQGLAAAGITKPSSDYEAFILAAQTVVDSADPINFYNNIVKPNGTGTTPGSTARPILFQEIVGSPTVSPDKVVPNNVFGLPTQDGSVGKAFATIYSKGGVLSPATYNPANTVPGLLSGSDPLVRGTAFLAIATAAATAQATNDTATLTEMSAFLPSASAAVPNTTKIADLDTLGDGIIDDNPKLAGGFLGMNLVQVGEAGKAESRALVRFSKGNHSSLLDPSDNASVTKAMQTQIAGFIASVNGGVVSVPGTAQGVPAGVIQAP